MCRPMTLIRGRSHDDERLGRETERVATSGPEAEPATGPRHGVAGSGVADARYIGRRATGRTMRSARRRAGRATDGRGGWLRRGRGHIGAHGGDGYEFPNRLDYANR